MQSTIQFRLIAIRPMALTDPEYFEAIYRSFDLRSFTGEKIQFTQCEAC